MATNPIGKGTKTIGINMSKKMADELEKRATSMHISKSIYCKILLQQWLDSGKKLTLSEQSRYPEMDTQNALYNYRAFCLSSQVGQLDSMEPWAWILALFLFEKQEPHQPTLDDKTGNEIESG